MAHLIFAKGQVHLIVLVVALQGLLSGRLALHVSLPLSILVGRLAEIFPVPVGVELHSIRVELEIYSGWDTAPWVDTYYQDVVVPRLARTYMTTGMMLW